MKYFFVLALVAAVAAVPAKINDKKTEIARLEFDNIGVDGYKYLVETSDGVRKEESGVLKNVGTENEAIEVRGSFSYIGEDGVTYTITYVADENGFQPSGAHLPVAPSA